MADYNVILHRHNGGSAGDASDWDTMWPETSIDQISGVSAVGALLLAEDTPAENMFVRINSGGDLTLVDATLLKTLIDAADAVHGHTTDEITNGSAVTLTTLLSDKADLVNGMISASQIPDFLFGGLRYDGAFNGNSDGSNDGQIALSWIRTNGMLTGLDSASMAGGYLVASEDIILNFTDSVDYVVPPGDEGDYITGMTLEGGDWLVYTGYTTKHNWVIVNNRTNVATQDKQGIVQLSTGIATTRAALDNAALGDGLKVVDESALRKVVKDVFYQGSLPTTGLAGDIWVEIL